MKNKIIIGAIICGLVLMVAAPLVAQNSEYYEAYKIVPLLSFSIILHGFYTVISVGVILTKKTKYVIISNYSAAIVNIFLNLLMIPKYGMMGAAIASVIAYVINSILLFNFAQKSYYIKYKILNVIAHFSYILVVIGLCYYYDLSVLMKTVIALLTIIIMPFTGLVNCNNIRIIVIMVYKKLRIR